MTDIGIQVSDYCNGASSNGRTQAFGACRGGSTPPAPEIFREHGMGRQGTGIEELFVINFLTQT